MKIAFHVYHFTFRGSEIAAFDYALFNREILKNSSIIVIPRTQSQPENPLVKEKFENEFQIYYYDDLAHLEEICKRETVDALYTIKYGTKDKLLLKEIPVFVHCVFTTEEPHGTVYAGVSQSVARRNNKCETPFVNHMVYLPDIKTNFRDDLGIPSNAIVFGRHGGDDTFDLPFVKEAIIELLNERNDIFFLFAVRPRMMNDIEHSQIIYLDSFTDMRIKTKFINTCDAMIHACSLGESFGLSILEFCHQNKPVITWTGGAWHKQHHSNLGSKGIYYTNKTSVKKIMNEFSPSVHQGEDYKSLVLPFTPSKIMRQFDDVFLKAIK
ncbi:MAG: hypothetical protein PHG66_00780 [Candidatus Colwellbacteria bacterium]|nr:hypothetical protein [Candidatus Colwellbacteria bacterium]